MFDENKIIEAAKKLGLIVEVNSENPGFFFQNEDQQDIDSYNYAELNLNHSSMFKSVTLKENDVSIKSAEKVIITNDLKNKEVEYFKSNRSLFKKYSGIESKNVGEINYTGKTNQDTSMKVYNQPNKTDKAAWNNGGNNI